MLLASNTETEPPQVEDSRQVSPSASSAAVQDSEVFPFEFSWNAVPDDSLGTDTIDESGFGVGDSETAAIEEEAAEDLAEDYVDADVEAQERAAESVERDREERQLRAPIGEGSHVVIEGECIGNIAFRAGFFKDTIWKHSANSTLRRKRKDPNILMPGDVVFIPAKELKECSCATMERHTFVRKGVPAHLRLQLLWQDEPRRNESYILIVEGRQFNGMTDDEGCLDHPIPPDAITAKLLVGSGGDRDEYEIRLGGVDPLEEVSGVQSRLANLGYNCETTGELDDLTEAAVALFQKRHALPETGRPDSATLERLQSDHIT